MDLNYNKRSVDSIYEFALKLTGKSLSQVVNLPRDIEDAQNRGKLGTLVERLYFQITPPNNHEPDFPEADLELKVTGVKKNSAGKFVAKERLVLTQINFSKLAEETWENNTFYRKCKRMLVLFYQYGLGIPVVQQKFVLKPLLYEIPESDLSVIKGDWEKIQRKVLDGKAHEISEGDTYYLGACRKGAGGLDEKLQKQPFSDIGAPSRAFSFKQSYLNRFILLGQEVSTLGVGSEVSFEAATQSKFEAYLGRSIEDISSELQFWRRNPNHKSFFREIAIKILSNGGSQVGEIEKAGIELKTVRLQKNGKPRESMSFPGFNFLDIGNEVWEETKFFEKIERKFLFVVFGENQDGIERLLKVGYWNMPFEDRKESERVWRETKRRVGINAHDLPGMTESLVAHVRPKARDGKDKALTPQGDYRTKQCFWLNASYIAKVVSTI